MEKIIAAFEEFMTSERAEDIELLDKLAGMIRQQAERVRIKRHQVATPDFEERVKVLHTKLGDFKEEFETRTYNILKSTGHTDVTVGEFLADITEGELLKLKNFGRHSLNSVREWLAAKGLSIGMDLSLYLPGFERKYR